MGEHFGGRLAVTDLMHSHVAVAATHFSYCYRYWRPPEMLTSAARQFCQSVTRSTLTDKWQ